MLIELFVISLLIIIIYTLLIFGLSNTLYFSTALFVWPPSVPTDRKTRKKLIYLLDKIIENKPKKLHLADLGSGFGHIVFKLSKYYPHHNITGYEILKAPYLLTNIASKLTNRNNLQIKNQNLLHANIKKFDVIFCFLSGSINKQLSEKIDKESKKGCVIISNNFQLPSLNLIDTIEISDLLSKRKIFIYEK